MAEDVNNGRRSWWADEDPQNHLIPESPEMLNLYKDYSFNVIMKGRTDLLKSSRPKTIYEILYKSDPKPINNIYSCKKMKSGDFLMNIDAREKEKVMNLTQIGEIPVFFKEAWDMNNTKVTIFNEDLINYPMDNDKNINEELLQDLQSQNPNTNILNAQIQNVFNKNSNRRINSKRAIITLEGKISELELNQKRLMLNLESLPVQLYIPDPKICKNCWSYDHISTKTYPCPNPHKICGNCAKNFHLPTENSKIIGKCDCDPKCVNCKQYHPAWSRDCPFYKKEKKFWEIATKQRISYRQAKHIQEDKPRTYANTTSTGSITPTVLPTDYNRQHSTIQNTDKLSKKINMITKQLNCLMVIIRKICQASDINLTNISQDDMDIPTSDIESDEPTIIPPTPVNQPRGRVAPFSAAELQRFNQRSRGNNNGEASFNRAKQRQNKNEKSDNVPPNKIKKPNN